MIGVVKLATPRWARWVRKATRNSVRAPWPHRYHYLIAATAIAARAVNAVFAGDSALPTMSAFPRRQRLRWGVVGGLRGGRGAGLRYRYRNRKRQTVDCRLSVLAAGGKIWVVPRGGAVRTVDWE